MSLESEMDSALREMIDAAGPVAMGSSWLWNGESYTGIQGDMATGDDPRLLGTEDEVRFDVTFAKSDFGGQIPDAGDLMTDEDSGTAYRVISTATSAGDPGLIVTCGSAKR
jgi:hypothetical protein